MKRGPHLALAIGLGYFLGRRRTLRTALVLGAAAAAGRFSRDPGQLLTRGTKALGGSAELRKVAELGGPLVKAGKAAARTAVTNQIDAMSERIQDRGDALRRPRREEPDEGPADEEYEEYEDDRDDRDDRRRSRRQTAAEEPEDDEQDDAPPRRASRGRSGGVPVRRRGR